MPGFRHMTARNMLGEKRSVYFDKTPDVCPICHTSIHPKTIANSFKDPHVGGRLQIVYLCTKPDCQRLFIGVYEHKHDPGCGTTHNYYVLRQVVPVEVEDLEFPPEVTELSPSFCRIFNQAHAAETRGLDEICGVGYRKALECLIKDYCKSAQPDKEDEIERKFLGQCIAEHIEDPNIKRCAKRAAWLGSYETHYLRKWTPKDINDLKILIQLTQNWIQNTILTQKYMKERGVSVSRSP